MAPSKKKPEKSNGIQALDAALRVLAEMGKAKTESRLTSFM